jgi:DNA-binding MarR family transcriptional regulator
MTLDEKSKFEDPINQVIDRFWETVPAVWDRIRQNVRGIATDQFNISVEQFHILRHIRKGKQSVSDLATVKNITRSAISQSVDVLVEKGLISRQQQSDDRRCVLLELTQSGNDLLNAIFFENRKWMSGKLQALNPDESKVVLEGLDILKQLFL